MEPKSLNAYIYERLQKCLDHHIHHEGSAEEKYAHMLFIVNDLCIDIEINKKLEAMKE